MVRCTDAAALNYVTYNVQTKKIHRNMQPMQGIITGYTPAMDTAAEKATNHMPGECDDIQIDSLGT